MKKIETKLKDCYIIEPDKFGDHRGYYSPFFAEKDSDFYTKKRYLVTGVSGQLGYDVVKELNKRGIYDILALNSTDMDITDARIVNKIISEYKPEVVFHCAAWTNVDGAEDNKEACYKVNVEGTKNITNACRMVDAKLIYVSTDYVFDGLKDGIYEVTDSVNPQNVYGQSKAEGEQIVNSYDKSFIARTSWVFGVNGKNFVKTMLRLAEIKSELNVVCDQIGSPTYTVDLAKTLVDMSETDNYGLYHINNEGFCSWAEFSKYIFESSNIDMTVNEVPTSEYPQKATRPLNAKLSKSCLDENNFDRLPDWKNAVDRFKEQLIEENCEEAKILIKHKKR